MPPGPIELGRHFPRIANSLAANWKEPDATRIYLDDLLHDRRGNRQGFPPAISAELIALQSLFDRLHPAAEAAAAEEVAPAMSKGTAAVEEIGPAMRTGTSG